MDAGWWIGNFGYLGVASLIVGESLGLPVPGQVGLLLAAYLSPSLGLDPVVLIFVAASAHFVGSLASYGLARRLGWKGVEGVRSRLAVVGRGVERAEAAVRRWATWGVFALQLVPYLRDYLRYAAGLAGIGIVRYAAGLLPASLLWSGASLAIGTGAALTLSPDFLLGYFAGHWEWIVAVSLGLILTVVAVKRVALGLGKKWTD